MLEMSESSDDDELSKSGRFNKFETENKRKSSSTPRLQPSIQKNLANDRLTKLKQRLQNEVVREIHVQNKTNHGRVIHKNPNDNKVNGKLTNRKHVKDNVEHSDGKGGQNLPHSDGMGRQNLPRSDGKGRQNLPHSDGKGRQNLPPENIKRCSDQPARWNEKNVPVKRKPVNRPNPWAQPSPWIQKVVAVKTALNTALDRLNPWNQPDIRSADINISKACNQPILPANHPVLRVNKPVLPINQPVLPVVPPVNTSNIVNNSFAPKPFQNSSSSVRQTKSLSSLKANARNKPYNIEIKVNTNVSPHKSLSSSNLSERIVKIRDSVTKSDDKMVSKSRKSDDGYWVTTVHTPVSSESGSSQATSPEYISPLLRISGSKRKHPVEQDNDVSVPKQPLLERKLPFYIPPPGIPTGLKRASDEEMIVSSSPSGSSFSVLENSASTNHIRTKVTKNQKSSTSNYHEEAMEKMDVDNSEMDEEFVPITPPKHKSPKIEAKGKKSKDLCVVIDTNVFVQALPKIRELVDMEIRGPIQLVLLIPWMVTQELDNLKDTCFTNVLKRNTTNAIKFLNKLLEGKNPRIKGQTSDEMAQQKFIGPSQDDKIIACCLQAAENYEKVILMTADTNLRNKAVISNIEVSSNEEVMKKVMLVLGQNVKFCEIQEKMNKMCTYVICECAKEAYGKVWNQMALLEDPPWSLTECLQRFKKYWTAVFRNQMMKQFMKTVEKLLTFLSFQKYVKDDSSEYVEFVKLCVDICIFLKDIHECRNTVQTTLDEITRLS